jgi:formylmethanofuran dehydrogenase subunit B
MTEVAVLVNGTPASLTEATRAAAALLAGSRSAVVAGVGTDVAGTRASIALARAVGACIDHMDGDAVFANLDVMRRAGWIVTTPLQVRARADTVLLVGDGLEAAWPEMAERLGLEVAPTLVGGARRVLRLGSGAVGGLAALRALVAGRRITLDEAAAEPLRVLAGELAAARFGVVVWSAAALDTLAIEMLCGLIDDLNKKTRFAGLPLVPGNGAEGVVQTAAWSTGFPIRTGFAGADPLHDPWRFDAGRLVASGEADAAVWVSALSAVPPPWANAVPTIALVAAGTVFDVPAAVMVEVGCPGRDHDAMLYDQGLGGIVFAAAGAPRVVPTVAEMITAILAALPSC